MILEGARWCLERRYLAESESKILYTPCPMVHFMPKKNNEIQVEGVFACPLFKTADRLGVLMTTGHSTNYVCDIRLPTEVATKHWIMRGAAMLLSLSE
jgi:dynein heavy chain, axonemal